MSTQDNGGPALPLVELDRVTGEVCDQHFGMSMRDYFAAKAMPAWDMSSLHDIEAVYERCATHAYRMADAMLKAREQ